MQHGLSTFSDDLQRTIESRAAAVDLPTLDASHDVDELLDFIGQLPTAGKQTRGKRQPHLNPRIVRECFDLMQQWCDVVQAQLKEDSTVGMGDDDGPTDVLTWWRKRMERLSSVTEQLKTKTSTSVLSVLLAAGRSGSPSSAHALLYPPQAAASDDGAATGGGGSSPEGKSTEDEEGKSEAAPAK